MTREELQLGGDDDIVRIRLNGTDVRICESYEVHMSVLQQPAAFTVRIGWGEVARDLLRQFQPGSTFELLIHDRVIQSGRVDSHGVPSGNVTQVELKGRDFLAPLFDAFVEDEISLNDATYGKLTRHVLDIVGLTEAKGHVLETDNEANRQLIGRVRVAPPSATQKLAEIETGAAAGPSQVVYQSIKAKLGERWYDLLQRHYKLAGLFIWAGGDGRIVLARPRAEQSASYRLFRRRSGSGNEAGSNILTAHFENNCASRHSAVVVYGRHGSAASGRHKVRSILLDPEVVEFEFPAKTLTVYDEDVSSQDEADYVARRTMAEEHRENFTLEYTVAGHTTVGMNGDVVTWVPDTIVRVEDAELFDTASDYYVESVRYSRAPETTTTLTLVRPEDLVFAKTEEIKHKSVFKKAFGTGKQKSTVQR